MLTKFDENAQKAIVVAESLAFDLGHEKVQSEFLLLSLLKMKQCTFAEVLKVNYGIDDEMVYDDIVHLLGEKDIQPFYMEYSSEFKNILDEALDIGRKKNEKHISLNSLSLALLGDANKQIHILLGISNLEKDDIEEIKAKLQDNCDFEDTNISSQLKECSSFATILQPSPHKIILERDVEIKNLIIGLSCKEKSNVAITGKAGVGKSAIVDELARVLKYNQPKNLTGYQIISLSLNSAVAGTKYRGELEEKIQKLLKATKNEKVIIFIDEGHDMMKAGASNESLSISDMIKPVMARDNYKFIVATTDDEYNTFIQQDAALNRRFRKVSIAEPEVSKVKTMISKKIESYSEFHKVVIEDEDIQQIIDLCVDIPNRYFPDKVLDVLDYSMAYCQYEEENEFKLEIAKNYIHQLKGTQTNSQEKELVC